MFRTVIWVSLLSIVVQTASYSQANPVLGWKKKLPSTCRFVAIREDSIICVGNEISVLSLDGTMLSQSKQLDDTKDLVGNSPLFYYSKDNSIILIKDECIVKKISLDGQTEWEKPFCDSVQGVIFNGFTEDDDGNVYLCGTVLRNAGLIVKLGNDGNYTWKADSLFGSFFSFEWLRDSLFVISADRQNPYNSKSLGVFDNRGNFVKQIVDTGCGSSIVVDTGNFFVIGQKQGNSLFKRTFMQTSDIILKIFSSNGRIDTVCAFDFGKWENPISIQKCDDGFLMTTKSDETMNMGTSYLNYYLTKFDGSLNKLWQLHFGTDTGGLSGRGNQYRFFATDGRGKILATHNDSIFKFTDGLTEIENKQFSLKEKSRILTGMTRKVYDLQGHLLFEYRSRSLSDVKQLKYSGISSGLKLISSKYNSEGEIKIFYLNR